MASTSKKTHRPCVIDLQEFLPTIRYWARHYAHRSHQILDFEDLMVVGMMGLMDAAGKFNPQRDVQFKTYAEFRIRGEIIDELRRQDWMSRSERKKQRQFRAAQHALEQHLGRSPTGQEMARVLPFRPRELDRLRQYEGSETIRSYQEGDVSPEHAQDDVARRIELRDELSALLEQLSPVHRRVLELRYFEDAPLAQIAREIRLSEGRVSQLITEALEQLRGLAPAQAA